jgi:hypothetical protein
VSLDSARRSLVNKSHQVNQQSEQLLSRRALAQRWSCCNETIKRREREGILKSIRFNQRLLRYRLSDIVAIEAAAGGTPQ